MTGRPSTADRSEPHDFDPLNMDNYRVETMRAREKSRAERILAAIGVPLALLSFALIMRWDAAFLRGVDPAGLGKKALAHYDQVGATAFHHANRAMLAVFVAALILWLTEAIPSYLTSLILIVALVLLKVLPEQTAYAQLGHNVMWLNILSFILSSALVATGVAKRFALWFLLRFGRSPTSIFVSFIIINVVLSAFISATTAKAALLLPIFMVVAAVYGARGGREKNNFGRNVVLLNLLANNLGASAFMTGSGANLVAVSLMIGATGQRIFYQDWLRVAFPQVVVLLVVAWFLGTRVFFRLSPDERVPRISGGLETLRSELAGLGRMDIRSVKAVVIFVAILALWATDRYHGISATAVAFVGAIAALMPRVGVIEWNQVDIPWHLLLFSAGAYTLGAGLEVTDLPAISVNAAFERLGIGSGAPFWLLYLVLTGAMVFSALAFQSKTMRAMIFVPIAIGVAKRSGYPVLSLAMPVSMLIEHVYALPFNSKPAMLLYSTDQYSLTDTFKYGVSMLFLSWLLALAAGETWWRFLGYTSQGVFGG